MTRIAGIQIENDSKGRPAYARFNLKKHPAALELLYKAGAFNDIEFEKEFEKEWENGITTEELRAEMKDHIKKLFKTKK